MAFILLISFKIGVSIKSKKQLFTDLLLAGSGEERRVGILNVFIQIMRVVPVLIKSIKSTLALGASSVFFTGCCGFFLLPEAAACCA